ncbi:MAG: pilus assembly protein PilM [Pseudomonadota bacterium]
MKIGAFDLHEFIDGIRWRRERLGVDIDGKAVRIAKVKRRSDGGYSVAAFTEIDIDLMQADDLKKQRFKLAIRHIGEGLNRVAVKAEHPSLRVRRMNFAKMPDGDLLEAIRWNFREHVEGNIEKYIVGYSPLEGVAEEGERIPILAYGLASEVIDDYLQLLTSLGLKPVSLEPSASALLASFHANGILSDDRYHVCVSFGEVMSLFSVMRGTLVLFWRPLLGIHHEALIKFVMRNLNLESDEARRVLTSWSSGAKSSNDDLMHRIETTIGLFFSQLVIEMQRSIDAFCIMYGVDRVDTIHICGMGAKYPGVTEHMQTNLGVETDIFNPFKNLMDPIKQTDEVTRVAPLYAVAVGLAIP